MGSSLLLNVIIDDLRLLSLSNVVDVTEEEEDSLFINVVIYIVIITVNINPTHNKIEQDDEFFREYGCSSSSLMCIKGLVDNMMNIYVLMGKGGG
jgi:hypothetical protein